MIESVGLTLILRVGAPVLHYTVALLGTTLKVNVTGTLEQVLLEPLITAFTGAKTFTRTVRLFVQPFSVVTVR